MSKITLDFSKVVEFELLPKGEYIASVFQVEKKETTSGNEYLTWTFKILEGEYTGRKMFLNTSLQPRALWRLQKILKALNIDAKGKIRLDLENLLGKKCKIIIIHENFDGEPVAKIREVLRSRGEEIDFESKEESESEEEIKVDDYIDLDEKQEEKKKKKLI